MIAKEWGGVKKSTFQMKFLRVQVWWQASRWNNHLFWWWFSLLQVFSHFKWQLVTSSYSCWPSFLIILVIRIASTQHTAEQLLRDVVLVLVVAGGVAHNYVILMFLEPDSHDVQGVIRTLIYVICGIWGYYFLSYSWFYFSITLSKYSSYHFAEQ